MQSGAVGAPRPRQTPLDGSLAGVEMMRRYDSEVARCVEDAEGRGVLPESHHADDAPRVRVGRHSVAVEEGAVVAQHCIRWGSVAAVVDLVHPPHDQDVRHARTGLDGTLTRAFGHLPVLIPPRTSGRAVPRLPITAKLRSDRGLTGVS